MFFWCLREYYDEQFLLLEKHLLNFYCNNTNILGTIPVVCDFASKGLCKTISKFDIV